MKKNCLILFSLLSLCLFINRVSNGQEVIKIVGYKKDGTTDPGSKPALKAYFIKNPDSSFEKLTYKSKGICQLHETYADADFLIWHGIFVSYTKQGWVNEMGFYRSGKRSGQWYRRIGVFYYAIDIYNNGVANATDSIYINPTSKNQAFVKKNADKNDIIDASYPGGDAAYRKYLNDQLLRSRFAKTEERFEPIVAFFVQPTGTVSPVAVWQSNNFEVDFFARQTMQSMPGWIPAKEATTGKNVAILYFQRMAIYQY